MTTPIRGIHCAIMTPAVRYLIEQALARIEAADPASYVLILSTVRSFAPLPEDEVEKGACGWCVGLHPPPGDAEAQRVAQMEWGWVIPQPCDILLIDREPEDAAHVLGTIAHELGHAATMFDDLEECGDCPSDEWRGELTADRFAHRWGFWPQIEPYLDGRAFPHHIGSPGDTITEGDHVYRITDGFRMEYVGKAEPPAA